MDEKIDQSQIDAFKKLCDDEKVMKQIIKEYPMEFEACKKMQGNMEHMTPAIFLDPSDRIKQLGYPVSIALRNILKATPFKPFIDYFSELSVFISKKGNIYINFGRKINGRMFLGFSVQIQAYKYGVVIKKIVCKCVYGEEEKDFVKAPCMEQLKQSSYQLKRKADHNVTELAAFMGLPARSASVVLENWHPRKRAEH